MDPQLPQLETALDPQAMLDVFQADWLSAPGRFQLNSCRIGSVRHKPGKSCLIRYDLSLRDLDRGTELRQVLCGRLHEQGSSEPRWRKAIAQPLVEVAPGPAVAHIARLGLVLWAFPNERKLRGLETLLDRRQLSGSVLPAILGAPVEVDEDPELIRYVPEHGCTVRVRATLPGSRTGIVLYGKIQVNEAGLEACAFAHGLGRRAWYHTETRTLWQEEIPGVSASVPADLEPCARALAAFHRTLLPNLPPAAPGRDDPDHFTPASQLLAGRAGVQLDEMIAEIKRRRRPAAGLATLHGDLHLKNFLVHEGHAELIDLDTAREGNPLDDLGSFAASLYHRAALDGAAIDQVDRAIASFLAVYTRHVPWQITPRDLAVQTAAALITERACRSVTRRKGDVVNQLLSIAQRLLTESATARDIMNRFAEAALHCGGPLVDAHYRTFLKPKSWKNSTATLAWRDAEGIAVQRIGAVSASWRFPYDPAVPWMAEVADPAAVRSHLPVPASHVEIDVLTYRPENRLTARYRIVHQGQSQTIYGKTYSNGHGELVNRRLHHLAARGFLMPSPLGYSPAIRTVWQAAFEGVPVRELVQGPRGAELLAGAARQLLALHESGMECSPHLTLKEMHADLAKKMAKLALVVPAAEARLGRIVDRLGLTLSGLAPIAPRVVHGDFHIRQLMARGREVALFDFDEAAWGDPIEDFGHFLADLHGDGFEDSFAGSAAATLLASYRAAGGPPVDPERLRWHTACHLLTRAYRALLQLKPDFDARVERHIHLAESLV